MRAASLPQNLLAAYLRGVAPHSAYNAMLRGASRNMSGAKVLGDAVIRTSDGSVVGDTADVSTLPSDYADGLAAGVYYLNAGVSGANATPGGSGQPSSWLTAITDALPKVSSFVTAQQIAQVNVDRAKQGLPALPAASYAPSVGVAISPATTSALTMAALGVAAIFVLPKLLKKGRR